MMEVRCIENFSTDSSFGRKIVVVVVVVVLINVVLLTNHRHFRTLYSNVPFPVIPLVSSMTS